MSFPCILSNASGWFGVETNSHSQAQDCQGNQELEKLDYKLRCLVLVVERLLRWSVLGPGGDSGCVNLSNIVLIHHHYCASTMPNILKIISCILPCQTTRVSLFIWIVSMQGTHINLWNCKFWHKALEKFVPVADNKTSSPPGWSSKNFVTSYTCWHISM